LPFSIAIGLNQKRDKEQPHQDDHHQDPDSEVRPLKCDQRIEWHRLNSLSTVVMNTIVVWAISGVCALVHTSTRARLTPGRGWLRKEDAVGLLGSRSAKMLNGMGNEVDTYADDRATLVETLDLKNAIHIGHSADGGEIARCIGRNRTKRGEGCRSTPHNWSKS
jgi:hypothetical protein